MLCNKYDLKFSENSTHLWAHSSILQSLCLAWQGSLLGSYKTEIRLSLGCSEYFPNFIGCWKNLFYCGCTNEVPVLVYPLVGEYSQLLQAIPLHWYFSTWMLAFLKSSKCLYLNSLPAASQKNLCAFKWLLWLD